MTSSRLLLWAGDQICGEYAADGSVSKRFFQQGVALESGVGAGAYFHTRDHLGSIHELTDSTGNIRARYSYDPFGRPTKLTGDLATDFGFAGMFFVAELGINATRFRSYDPGFGRWLARDPLEDAEQKQGPNLYAYVGNNPVNLVDPSGLGCDCQKEYNAGVDALRKAALACGTAAYSSFANPAADAACVYLMYKAWQARQDYLRCLTALNAHWNVTPLVTATTTENLVPRRLCPGRG